MVDLEEEEDWSTQDEPEEEDTERYYKHTCNIVNQFFSLSFSVLITQITVKSVKNAFTI